MSQVDDIAGATGNAQQSISLHLDRSLLSPSEDTVQRDNRQKASFKRRTGIFAAVLGTVTATSILSWRRHSPSSFFHSSSSSSSSNNNFLQRYLVAPVLLPVSFGLGFVFFRNLVLKREFRNREREREEWELQNYRQGEIDEMIRIYQGRGLSKEQATQLVKIMSSDDPFFVDTMMTDELGFSPVEPLATSEALEVSFLGAASFFVSAVIPLFAAHHADQQNSNNNNNNNNKGEQLSNSKFPEGVLLATSVCVALLQARLLLRTYTSKKDFAVNAVTNVCLMGLTYFGAGALCASS